MGFLYRAGKIKKGLRNYWTLRYGQDGKPTNDLSMTTVVDIDAMISSLGNPIWSRVAHRMTPRRLEMSLSKFSPAQQVILSWYLLDKTKDEDYTNIAEPESLIYEMYKLQERR